MSDSGQRGLTSRLRLAVVRLNRRLRAQRTADDLSLTQLSALASLAKCGPMSAGRLAGVEGVRPPSMTRVIAALEEAGHVSRGVNPDDGRQAIVGLTDTGRQRVAADISAREAWLDRRLAELGPAEREILDRAAEIIDRMAGNKD
ncbi:MarR family winged helix-turn-helix transcriptional regulator [Actinokineospora pegani]|uniref:MarR family winged helix-turn-helix transcriptional regulator n=1 Tax=Actinokineospora pegani TaxID=2654637 RepID=UPI0012EAB05A|nr:MarR family transcriptional regulator [Actinokineospora pegani]